MLAAGRVKSFSVGLAPAVHFPTSAANTTRHKMSAKSYEITVQFANGVDTRDVMDHIGSGAARDCFKLRELPMVLKWFTETTDARYTHLHQGELDGYLRVAGQPVAQHLPAVYATRKLEVQNAKSGGTMEVDCLLTEFVGPTLYELCRDKDLSENDVQKLFVKLLLMIEKFTAANVSWGHDFHSRNICYHKLKGVWMMVDLEGVDPPSGLISSQVNKAGQRLRKDLQTETKPAFQEFTRLILQFMVIQTAPWQWDGTSVTPVARQLGIDINSLEARRMDHEDHVFDPIFFGGDQETASAVPDFQAWSRFMSISVKAAMLRPMSVYLVHCHNRCILNRSSAQLCIDLRNTTDTRKQQSLQVSDTRHPHAFVIL